MERVETQTNPLFQLIAAGQSPWLDNFRRSWLLSGEIERMIKEDGIRGVTVNPTIFEKAVSGSTDYDAAIEELVAHGNDVTQVYEALMVEDIRMAADLFRPLYDETGGADGFVSIELPPALAYDTVGTVMEARRFREIIDRKNIFVKVPGTQQGVPAIEELIYSGVNVNITLLFDVDNYEQVALAYIGGLERRAEEGESLSDVASVASFFVSRIDAAVDRQLQALISETESAQRRAELESLLGKAAIANAKLAYRRFQDIFAGQEFTELKERGARVQRVLWASTSTKDPRYPDTYYVDNLIGPDTVNTMPNQTLEAFRDHGHVSITLGEGLDEACGTMHRIKEAGIDFSDVTRRLQREGVESFQKSVDTMMSSLIAKGRATPPDEDNG